LPIEGAGFTISGTTTWNGTTTDWETASNWDSGVPTNDVTTIIPSTSNDPQIGGDVIAGNITIETGDSLQVLNGNTLNVKREIELQSTTTFDAGSGIYLVRVKTDQGFVSRKLLF